MPAPYSHAVYQIVKPSDLGGGTHYANINKCLGDYATLSAENYARTLDFERIRTVSDVTGLEFPLGYKHPVTGKAVILNAGMRQASRITMAGKRQVGKDELGKEELRELRRTIVDLSEHIMIAHLSHHTVAPSHADRCCHQWRTMTRDMSINGRPVTLSSRTTWR